MTRPPTAAEALRTVADGDDTDGQAARYLLDLGLVAKRKGRWVLTGAGKAALPPDPGPPRALGADAAEFAARLPPQPRSPHPTGKLPDDA